MESTAKRTVLYPCHILAGARMVDFGGWEMPVQYRGIIEEHQAVRRAVGLFDISHMGQITVSGPRSEFWLDALLTNRAARLAAGQGQYTLMLNPEGGVIDDLFLYRLTSENWLLVVNASKREEDNAWMQAHLMEGVHLSGPAPDRAAIAVQGPHAPALMCAMFGESLALPARNEICAIPGREILLAATGYTGEEGFELFLATDQAVALWDALLALGESHGLSLCGLGARDTLRLEKCYPLNGSDLSPQRTPFEAGLGIFIDLSKEDFIGSDALKQQKAAGVPYFLRAFKMTEKSPPPRSHYPVYKDDALVGEVASGTLSPSLGTGIGMAYLPAANARIGDSVEIDIRGKRFSAILHKKPLYP